MKPPPAILSAVQLALSEVDGTLRTTAPLGGGCISNGNVLTTVEGQHFFLKWREDAPPGMYAAEANGLDALRTAAGSEVRVPAVVALADQWLLLEYIAPAERQAETDSRFGRGLATIHESAQSETTFGWPIRNWIGTLPQENPSSASWATFWLDARLRPQLARARAAGHFPATGRASGAMDRLLSTVQDALSGVRQVSLLHGDLWAGNAFPDRRGRPVLIDPATYHGHSEVDLAMTELFGGFGPDFYAGYDDVRTIDAGYRSHRRDLYQLYYLLVHVNLFGGSYIERAVQTALRVVAALR